jgi:hypothetical protein
MSNLTLWDTYGKLIGLNRTAPQLRKNLNELRGWGAYMVYAGIDAVAADATSESPQLHLTDLQEGIVYDPEAAQFAFNSASAWDPRAPDGKRAVTIHSLTDVAASTKAEDYFEAESKKLDDKFVETYKANKVEVVTMSDAEFDAWRNVAKNTSYKNFAEKVPGGKELIDKALSVK